MTKSPSLHKSVFNILVLRFFFSFLSLLCTFFLFLCPYSLSFNDCGLICKQVFASTSDSGAGTDTGADTGTGTDSGTDTGTGTDSGTDTGTGTDSGTDTEAGTDSGTDTGTGTDSETDSGTETDSGNNNTDNRDVVGGDYYTEDDDLHSENHQIDSFDGNSISAQSADQSDNDNDPFTLNKVKKNTSGFGDKDEKLLQLGNIKNLIPVSSQEEAKILGTSWDSTEQPSPSAQ